MWVAPIFELDLYLFMIHLYTKYHLNPSNHYWENEQKLSLSRVWRTDGRRTGRTSPYHNTSRFQQAYKNEWTQSHSQNICSVVSSSLWQKVHILDFTFLILNRKEFVAKIPLIVLY
jgi:hypothetical protein